MTKSGIKPIWQVKMTDLLSGEGAPRIITPAVLDRFADSLPDPPSRTSIYRWINEAMDEGVFERAGRAVYLNNLVEPKPIPDEALQALQPKATVSLQRVLSQSGAYIGDGSIITAVVPIERKATPPKVGVFEYGIGTIWLFSIPEHVLFAPPREIRLQAGALYPVATPEKALADWLYLGATPRSRLEPPPVQDLNFNRINQTRMQRVANAMGVGDIWIELLRTAISEGHNTLGFGAEAERGVDNPTPQLPFSG